MQEVRVKDIAQFIVDNYEPWKDLELGKLIYLIQWWITKDCLSVVTIDGEIICLCAGRALSKLEDYKYLYAFCEAEEDYILYVDLLITTAPEHTRLVVDSIQERFSLNNPDYFYYFSDHNMKLKKTNKQRFINLLTRNAQLVGDN